MMMPRSWKAASVAAAAIAGVGLPSTLVVAGEPDQITPEIARRMAEARGGAQDNDKPEFPKFDDVSEGYTKVISTADGRSLYTLYVREKDGQVLAELPRNYERQKLFIAYNLAGGHLYAGIQLNDQYAYWKRYDKKLALLEPNYAVRTSGDLESQKGRERVYTDRVLLEVPIVTMGPGGGPVIDLDGMLIGQADKFFFGRARGLNRGLVQVTKAKAFPENVELAFELPDSSGRLVTLRYSISVLPEKTGYKARMADARVGYFTTVHLDLGKPGEDDPYVRYANRWNLEKAEPRLHLSPPKEPIVFYLEHTIPVRYRRWVREGVLEWNKAFEKIGIVNAIEVRQQDARTGAHMDKDPEDVRYNFVLWTNAQIGFAIGPSRVDPLTGQILDADIVMSEGFIRSWARQWREMIPQLATEGFAPETFEWLLEHPQWDPRVRLAPITERSAVAERIRAEHARGGHPALSADPSLLGDDVYDGLAGRTSQVNGACNYAMMKTLDLALFRLDPAFFQALARGQDEQEEDADDARQDEENGDEQEQDAPEPDEPEEDILDGVPESFIGPLLKDVVMHEVGHTLGLRHNFKASSVYSIQEVNDADFRGRAHTGSVMEYNPININFDDGPEQGDWTMVTIGPYDEWAIEYGYTLEKKLDPIVKRVAEEELPYATDEDTWGPDPLARRFDFGADPLDYADSQMRLMQHLRGEILERIVKQGESWQKARDAYLLLLGRHINAVSIAANWIGGSYVNRDRKGDPGDRDPVTPVSAQKQRRGLRFVIDNTFDEAAFGLTPELLAKMTVDKWWDEGGSRYIFEDPGFPVHDRIMAIQTSALTMLMNPTTLRRVYDNEFRIPAEEDAFTLPEIIHEVSDAIWSELDRGHNGTYTARQPMVSSLRRNLQAEHLERLIDLSIDPGRGAAARPISTLCVKKLHELKDKIDRALDSAGYRIDPYTEAHLAQIRTRIERALDGQYIYNLDDLNVRVQMPTIRFGQEEDQ